LTEIPNFDKLVTHKSLSGDKVRIDDILNKPIIITGFQISSSKYRDKGSGYCIKVQFYAADDTTETRKVFFSGSSVLKHCCSYHLNCKLNKILFTSRKMGKIPPDVNLL
jgi:hypothetical protein